MSEEVTQIEEPVVETPVEGAEEPKEPEAKPEEKAKPEGQRNFKVERRIQHLVNEIRTLKAAKAEAPAQKPVEKPASMTTEADFEQMAAFKAQEMFQQLQREQAQKQEADEQARLDRQFEAGKLKAIEKYPDFEDVLESSLGLELHGAVVSAIKTSPVAHDLRYAIASDPELEERIANSNPIQAIRLIGQLEAKFTSSGSKKVTTAPTPIKPVGGRSTSGDIDPEKESPKEYAARRNKEEADRRRR